MVVPVSKQVTGRKLVVVMVASAVSEICESDRVLKCARFLHSSPDGVSIIYDQGMAAGHDICLGIRRRRFS